MTSSHSTRQFTIRTRVLLPAALAASTVSMAGPALAVPDAGTPTASSPATAPGAIGPGSDGATDAAADIARLRANFTRLHGSGYRATIWFDRTFGITVQRGDFAGRITEY
jgi:hypothetical protein